MTVMVESAPRRRRGACAPPATRDLAHQIKALIGVTATVETMPPGAIERSLGKAKRIIDLRPKTSTSFRSSAGKRGSQAHAATSRFGGMSGEWRTYA